MQSLSSCNMSTTDAERQRMEQGSSRIRKRLAEGHLNGTIEVYSIVSVG
jgi:hypothetical protein